MSKTLLLIVVCLVLTFGLSSCASRKKNTAQTRMYHSFATKYNTYHNGRIAYTSGKKAQIEGHRDNYLEMLPYLITSRSQTQKLGASNYGTSIEKAQKAIKNHSIKRKPIKKPGVRLSEKDKIFYAQKEFNPFLHNVWMLMANSYYKQGNYMEAASTYIYILRLYATNPVVVANARMKLAQCYTELDWIYEAEDLMNTIKRDSIPSSLKNEWAITSANFLIKQQEYTKAIPYITQALKRKKITKAEKAREYYLLGQLHKETGDNATAFKYFGKVINQGLLYELEFNARMKQTETVSTQDTKKIVRTLEKMLKLPKNMSYIDQIHYALGNIYLNTKDSTKAIDTYENGLAESTVKGYGTTLIHLMLGNLYWHQGKYSKAMPNYQNASKLLAENHPEIEQIKLRAAVLAELVKHTDVIELQGNLLHWASLTDEELYPVFDAMIAQVIKEDERNKKKNDNKNKEPNKGEKDALSIMADVGSSISSGEIMWYFYNPSIVSQGLTGFTQTWGERPLVDYWRLTQKISNSNTQNTPQDSIASKENKEVAASPPTAEAGNKTPEETPKDTLSKDPRSRAYYMQQIPRTEEKRKNAVKTLSEALFQAGIIYKDKLEDKQLTIKTLKRISEEFPEFDKMNEVYYLLFMAYSRWGETQEADLCRKELISRFPKSKQATTLADPNFVANILYGKQIEDSLYVSAYEDYIKQNYRAVIEKNIYSAGRYPGGAHRARLLYLDAMSKLYLNEKEQAFATIKEMTEKYPKEQIIPIVKGISQGIEEGRLLNSGASIPIWERRKGAFDPSINRDSIPTFSAQRAEPFYFILAYPIDSVDEKRLLFEMARYNFSKYMIRNFAMDFTKDMGVSMLQIKEFLNFDEAFVYMQRLYKNGEMATLLQGMRSFIISKTNLDLLVKHYSFNDYEEFYKKNFLKIPEPDIKGYTLDEPEFIIEN